MYATTTRVTTVRLPTVFLQAIDHLVQQGRYCTRSHFLRAAVRRLLRQHLGDLPKDLAEELEKVMKEEEEMEKYQRLLFCRRSSPSSSSS